MIKVFYGYDLYVSFLISVLVLDIGKVKFYRQKEFSHYMSYNFYVQYGFLKILFWVFFPQLNCK